MVEHIALPSPAPTYVRGCAGVGDLRHGRDAWDVDFDHSCWCGLYEQADGVFETRVRLCTAVHSPQLFFKPKIRYDCSAMRTWERPAVLATPLRLHDT